MSAQCGIVQDEVALAEGAALVSWPVSGSVAFA